MPETTNQSPPPPIQWAQRKNLVFLTVCLEDCKNPEIKLENDKLFFKGVGGTEKKEHQVTLDLFSKIIPEESKFAVRDRMVEFVLIKANREESFWTRLLKDNIKHHWLKVDFNKWKDEDDESDDEMGMAGEQGDFSDMMRQMGGLGMGGDKPNFDDLDVGADDEPDSDDEELPDLE